MAWAWALVAACTTGPDVVIRPQDGAPVRVRVEVALTPAARERGLMYRTKLADNAGMLFVFPDDADHRFWMKNTPLALDMVFIDREFTIVGIVENAVPFSTASVGAGQSSRYVLEVNAGFARRHRLRVGDPVRFRGVPREAFPP